MADWCSRKETLQCVASEADSILLGAFLDALQQAKSLDRTQVRSFAAASFASDRIVDQLIAALDERRGLAET